MLLHQYLHSPVSNGVKIRRRNGVAQDGVSMFRGAVLLGGRCKEQHRRKGEAEDQSVLILLALGSVGKQGDGCVGGE